MIDYVDAMCRSWGYARRKINGTPPQPKSIFGKFLATEGGPVAAASRGQLPAPLEVMLDDALITARAIQLAKEKGDLNLRQYEVLYARYVMNGSRRKKIEAVGVSESYFYRVLGRSHTILSGWLAGCETDHKKLKEIEGVIR